MAQGQFVSYLRVSTERQGRSGLGLEAQREAVSSYLNGGNWKLVAEVVEVESGGRNERPKLTEALTLCRVHKATLVIAKLDRLSRDAGFLFNLEADLQRMGLRFVAADMPDANEITVHIMAVVAQAERKMIGERTKRALAQKREWFLRLTEDERANLRAQGKAIQLGGDRGNLQAVGERGREISKQVRHDKAQGRAEDLAGVIRELREGGADSLRKLAAGLNQRGIETSRGRQWSANQVARVLSRLEAQ